MSGLELIASDLDRIREMFALLEQAAGVSGVHEVTIRFIGEGGDRITVGYGESAEPAVIEIREARYVKDQGE